MARSAGGGEARDRNQRAHTLPPMNRRTRGVLLGVASGVAMALVAEAVRPRGGTASPVDWDEITRLAGQWGGDGGTLTADEKAEAAALYNRLAAELEEPLLDAVGGLPAGIELPPFQALDRPAWTEVNLHILRGVIDPLISANPLPNSLVVEIGRAGINRYVALLLSYLSRRVLGQFDPNLLGREPIEGTTGLYLVETNVAAWQAQANLPGDELRRWLILHESTHAWQFLGHPWLRDHMNGMVEEALSMVGGSKDPVRRAAGLLFGVSGQLALLRRMQATMTLIEGYSNLVMDIVGREVLPGFAQLEAAYQERSGQRGPLETLFWRVTGLDMKMRQYRVGERFCLEVHRAHGMEALNLAWRGPEFLPRLPELDDAEAWYDRVRRLG